MKGRLLVVHDDPREILSVKRALAEAQAADVLGAHSREAARERLARNPEIRAVLLHWGSHDALRLAFELAEAATGVPVLAYSPEWREADQRRAAQVDVAAFLYAPLDGGEVAAELQMVLGGGEAPSRARLMRQRGAQLLAPDPALWALEDDTHWRDRMIGLADRVRAQSFAACTARGRGLRERLEAMAGGALLAEHWLALLAVAEQGVDRLDGVAERAHLDAALLGRLWARAVSFAPSIGGIDGLVVLIRTEAERARESAARGRSTLLAGLQRLAGGALTRGVGAPRPDPFATALVRALGLPPGLARRLPDAVVQALAGRCVQETTEAGALDHARAMLLRGVLSAARARPPDALDQQVMAGLLGLAPGIPGLSPAALLGGLGTLDPPGALATLPLDGLPAVSAALASAVPGTPEGALRGEVAVMLAADAPCGALDRRRLVALADAIEAGAADRVGPLAVRALARAVAAPEHEETGEALERLLFAFGASGLGDLPALGVALDAVATHHQAPLEANRLAAVLGAALSSEDPAGAVRHALGAPSAPIAARSSAERQRARLSAAVAGLPGVGDLAAFEAALPPPLAAGDTVPPSERLRLRALATLLRRCPDDRVRGALLQAALPPHVTVDRLVQLAQHAKALGDAHSAAVIAARVGVGTPALDAAGVTGLVDRANLNGAVYAAAHLPDETPGLAVALNALGLSLYEAGRAAESVPVYRRVMRLGPPALNVLFNAARAMLETDRLGDALDLAQRALELAPNLSPALALLSRVEGRLRGEVPA